MRLVMMLSVALAATAPAADRPKPQCTILVFGAHADDVEQIAGGTFAKYIRELKYKGVYGMAINNTAGNMLSGSSQFSLSIVHTPQIFPADALETIQVRGEEARRAAAFFGATPVFLNFREPDYWQGRKDTDVDSEDFTRQAPPGRPTIGNATRHRDDVEAVVEVLRRYQPEITIIHTLGGDKYDHGNAGYMMYLAFRRAIQKGIPVGKLWMVPGGWLREPEARENGRGKPDVVIDVTDYVETMCRALNLHVSQNGGLKCKDFIQPGKKYFEEFITVIDNATEKDRSQTGSKNLPPD